eukprot:362439-Chlamydomonas_euryale.AAC.2
MRAPGARASVPPCSHAATSDRQRVMPPALGPAGSSDSSDRSAWPARGRAKLPPVACPVSTCGRKE